MVAGAMDEDPKKVAQLSVRISDEMQAELDQYIERRSREARLTLSRAQAVRELLADILLSSKKRSDQEARARE